MNKSLNTKSYTLPVYRINETKVFTMRCDNLKYTYTIDKTYHRPTILWDFVFFALKYRHSKKIGFLAQSMLNNGELGNYQTYKTIKHFVVIIFSS